jgi:rhomboid-like protein
MQRTTPVVFNLLIINGLVFLAQQFLTATGINEWGPLYGYKSDFFKPYQLITHMFMHGGIAHILFNMFGLWMFGSILEKAWGSKKFLIFYMLCGIVAGAAEMFVLKDVLKYDAVLGQNILYLGQAVGASGAIMGVMAAFAYLFPNTPLYVMFIPVPVKAKFVIPAFILIDLFGGLYKIPGDNIAHFAHLGGALTGFILVLIWNKTNRKTFY